jgi:hypothetical protein
VFFSDGACVNRPSRLTEDMRLWAIYPPAGIEGLLAGRQSIEGASANLHQFTFRVFLFYSFYDVVKYDISSMNCDDAFTSPARLAGAPAANFSSAAVVVLGMT